MHMQQWQIYNIVYIVWYVIFNFETIGVQKLAFLTQHYISDRFPFGNTNLVHWIHLIPVQS